MGTAAARGVTPYLPLNLDPEVEREVERVLILGDKPVMRRPIPAALVLEALPKACTIDAPLCERVRAYLSRYMRATGVEFASAEASASSGHSNVAIPNDHGRTERNHYQLAAAGYVQLTDHLLVNVGGVANQDRLTPTGSLLSLGFDFAQLDVGYRDRWWSPMTDSSMLTSTESPTMPSITLSNYRPLTRLGIEYEVFVARLSRSARIELPNIGLTPGPLTTGYPKFAGASVSIQPTSGWSLGVNRTVVFGGGAAGGQSITSVLQAFFNPSKAQSTGFGTSRDVIGKQEASITSRFIFPGRVPFSVYFEYAGNDTSDGNNLLLGKPDMSIGIEFPRVGPFDVTLESSFWAPTWYVHGASNVQTGYLDGITNYFYSTGHWFGDQRQFGDAVGGRSAMLRVGWEPSFGGRVETQLRLLTNDSFYSAIPYRHEYMGSVSYSYPWREYAVGGQIDAGRDVFGARYARVQGFLRYGDALSRSGGGSAEVSSGGGGQRADGAELFVDAGVNASTTSVRITSLNPPAQTPTTAGPHLAIGARREVSAHQDLGVRLEADTVRGHALYTFRALDYRYRFNGPVALGLFFGASRYDLGTSAFGFALGTGLQWRNVLPNWDIGVDYRYAVKVARLRTLPTDQQGGFRPDSFFDIQNVNFYISRKF
jgi:hypothetical protein